MSEQNGCKSIRHMTGLRQGMNAAAAGSRAQSVRTQTAGRSRQEES